MAPWLQNSIREPSTIKKIALPASASPSALRPWEQWWSTLAVLACRRTGRTTAATGIQERSLLLRCVVGVGAEMADRRLMRGRLVHREVLWLLAAVGNYFACL